MRDFQTKSNSGGGADSIIATNHGAGEFNSLAVENEGACTSAGLTLANAAGAGEDSTQLAQALSIYGAGGAEYHIDTSVTPNLYTLNPLAPRQSPTAYFDGFTVSFEPGNINTGASTVNVASIGVVDLRDINGDELSGNEIQTYTIIRYDNSISKFKIIYSYRPSLFFSSASELRLSNYTARDGEVVSLTGFYSDGDGGGQILVWDATNTETNNNMTVFQRTGVVNGRYLSIDTSSLTVDHAGAYGDGTTDDEPYFDRAFAAIGIARLNPLKNYLIDGSNLTIPDYCKLEGPHLAPDPYAAAELVAMTGRIILNPTYTISHGESTSMTGCIATPKAMTFPQDTAGVAAWTGTAVTIPASTHGQYIGHCNIVGFEYGISTDDSDGKTGLRLEYLNMDCIHPTRIRHYVDIAYIDHVHCWPSATIDLAVKEGTENLRAGTAFSISDVGDWDRITDCFSWGYLTGYDIEDCNHPILDNCGADNDSINIYLGSTGFKISGTSGGVILSNCQAATCVNNFTIEPTAGNVVQLANCQTWGALSTNGVLVTSGDVQIIGGFYTDSDYAINVNNANSEVVIDCVGFRGITTVPINIHASNFTTKILNPHYYGAGAAGDYELSAGGTSHVATVNTAILEMPANLRKCHVDTSFDRINGGYEGQEIMIIFDGAVTVTKANNVKLATNTFAADDTITLVRDDGDWYGNGNV